MNEADTCRTYVIPLLQDAGWETSPHRVNEHNYAELYGSRYYVKQGENCEA